MSAVFAAIEQDDAQSVRELLREDAEAGKQRNADGVSALLLARYYGRDEIAQALKGATADLDVFEAAAYGDVDRLRALLDGDASLANAWAADGFQPLGLAAFFGQIEAVRVLVERSAEVDSPSRNDMKVRPLHSAAAASDPETRLEISKLLLEAGADPNAPQQDDFTPLMEADQHGDERLRALLVEHGATG